MPPFIDLFVDFPGIGAAGFLRSHRLRASPIKFFKKPVCIERFVRQQSAEFMAFNQVGDANDIVALPGHEHEVDQVSKRVRQREDLACDAASRFAYRLAFSPPFAPCPCL